MTYCVAQFIPIVLIFLFLKNNHMFIQFSKTIPGKMIAVALIIFYVCINKYIGLFACAVIIFFYQNYYIEAMEIMDIIEIDEIEQVTSEDVDDGTYIFMEKSDKIKGSSIDVARKSEVLGTYGVKPYAKVGVIDKKQLLLVEPTFSGSEDEFRKQNCERGVLKYKNMKVKNEMADIVFPQMNFKGAVCNPCNNTCDISV